MLYHCVLAVLFTVALLTVIHVKKLKSLKEQHQQTCGNKMVNITKDVTICAAHCQDVTVLTPVSVLTYLSSLACHFMLA